MTSSTPHLACRYIKGAQFFPEAAPKLAATGLGTVVSPDTKDLEAAAELEASVGNGLLNASSGPSPEPPTLFQQRLVGQGYKQVQPLL